MKRSDRKIRKTIVNALADLTYPYMNNLMFGRPQVVDDTEEHHQSFYGIMHQKPCGHEECFYITHAAGGTLGIRENGHTGRFVKTLTIDEAMGAFKAYRNSISRRRIRLITEIETDTLRRILEGEKLFAYTPEFAEGQRTVDVDSLWTPKEIQYAAGRSFAPDAYRTFGAHGEPELERCLCAERSVHQARAKLQLTQH